MRYFDTAHSSAHEGTNHGVKSHSAGVQTTMGIDLSAKTMNTQTNIKVAECEELIFHEATRTHKKWFNLPTAPYVVTVAESLLKQMMSRQEFYHAKLIARMVNRHVFQVVYDGHGQEVFSLREDRCVNDIQDSAIQSSEDSDTQSSDDYMNSNVCNDMHIPLFSRTRTVSVEHDGTMLCSCHMFERVGLPCTHQACVATLRYEAAHRESLSSCYLDTGNKGEQFFLGFNHHDVAVHWWASYMLYAYKETTKMAMNCYFHRLAMNDIKGPNLHVQISPLIALEDADDIAPAISRMKNYPGESIDMAKWREPVNTKRIVHLSQTQDEDTYDAIFNDLAEELRVDTSGPVSNIFSAFISNAEFEIGDNSSSRLARESLKQLWEESCSVADNLGTVGVKELERHLILFRKFCNESNKSTTDTEGKNIPMTQAKYTSTAKRINNTHHM